MSLTLLRTNLFSLNITIFSSTITRNPTKSVGRNISILVLVKSYFNKYLWFCNISTNGTVFCPWKMYFRILELFGMDCRKNNFKSSITTIYVYTILNPPWQWDTWISWFVSAHICVLVHANNYTCTRANLDQLLQNTCLQSCSHLH